MKTIIMSLMVVLLLSCSEPPVQVQTQSKYDISVLPGDFIKISNNYYSASYNCELISQEVYDSKSVQVYLQPVNRAYYVALPQTYLDQNSITTINFSFEPGKITFLISTNNKASVEGLAGIYHIVITD